MKAASSSDKLTAQRDSAAMRAATAARPERLPAIQDAVPPVAVPVPPPLPPRPVAAPEQLEETDLEEEEDDDDDGVKTSEYELLPSHVLKMDGTTLGPWTFARLMEALATGQIDPGDRVDFVGRGFRAAEEIDEFARFFPAPGATTSQLQGPGTPDLSDQIGPKTMLETLMLALAQNETGVLFVERSEGDGLGGPPPSRSGRKELYFVEEIGRAHV